jgi:hypothetical protein
LKSNSALLNVLIVGVAAMGAALIVAAAIAWSSEDMQFLLALGCLTVISEFMDFGPFANSRISVSIVLIFAAGAFSGLPGAVLIAGVCATADAVAHRKPHYKAIFNLGVLITTAAAYCGVVSLFSIDAHDWTARLGPSMAGATAAYVVNSGFVTMAISLENRLDPLSVWSSRFRWLLPHYIVIGLLAVLLALAYDRWDMAGLALFLVPLAMAWLAMKQYADSVVGMRPATSGTTA